MPRATAAFVTPTRSGAVTPPPAPWPSTSAPIGASAGCRCARAGPCAVRMDLGLIGQWIRAAQPRADLAGRDDRLAGAGVAHDRQRVARDRLREPRRIDVQPGGDVGRAQKSLVGRIVVHPRHSARRVRRWTAMAPSEPVRVDKWLWAARLAKTRGLAAEAVKAGRVEVNGQRVKPSKDVRPGDELEITTGPY